MSDNLTLTLARYAASTSCEQAAPRSEGARQAR